VKIIAVELDHLAGDALEESITHVILNCQLEDKTWRTIEIKLPSAEDLRSANLHDDLSSEAT
jgi:hypothetical protein